MCIDWALGCKWEKVKVAHFTALNSKTFIWPLRSPYLLSIAFWVGLGFHPPLQLISRFLCQNYHWIEFFCICKFSHLYLWIARYWRAAANTGMAVEERRPNTLVNSLTESNFRFKITWHCEIILSFVSCGINAFILEIFFSHLESVKSGMDVTQIFVVDVIIKISSRSISFAFNFRMTEIGIVISFVNTLGAELRAKQRHRNW